MDFTTVSTKLQSGLYANNFTNFIMAVRQIFMNAVIYNEPNTDVYDCAIAMSCIFETMLKENSLPIPLPLGLGRSTRWVDSPLGWKRAEVYFYKKVVKM